MSQPRFHTTITLDLGAAKLEFQQMSAMLLHALENHSSECARFGVSDMCEVRWHLDRRPLDTDKSSLRKVFRNVCRTEPTGSWHCSPPSVVRVGTEARKHCEAQDDGNRNNIIPTVSMLSQFSASSGRLDQFDTSTAGQLCYC